MTWLAEHVIESAGGVTPGFDMEGFVAEVTEWDGQTRVLLPELEEDPTALVEVLRRWDEAARFRMIRRGLGVDQEWLATRLGVDRKTIARWEAASNRRGIPDGVWADLAEVEAEWMTHVAEGDPGEDWPVGWRQAVEWRRRCDS